MIQEMPRFKRGAAEEKENKVDAGIPPVNNAVATSKAVDSEDHHWKPPNQDEVVNVCDHTNSNNSFIYCQGRILEAAMTHWFSLTSTNDSKTFVDKPLKFAALEVFRKFNELFPTVNNESNSVADIDPVKLNRFIEENFEQEGNELIACDLTDWNERPIMLQLIQDHTLREWSMKLNLIWRELCRQIKPDVLEHPDRFSLLYVPKSFVIPGGRFREFYYWDAYWIIKGLLVSGMHNTSRNMIENFAYMVEKYGFIPNGGRVYYLKRSQPPFLAAMVYEYYEATHDIEFILKMIPVLEKELEFWDTKRAIKVWKDGKYHEVYQYRTESNVPRPESFREDIHITKQLTKNQQKRQVWQDIASAAESGWDFSSRWLNVSDKLNTIQTTAIIPVDLNAFMCWNFNILSYLYYEIDDIDRSVHYQERYNKFLSTFQRMFYVKRESGWFDYNLKTEKNNMEFFASVATPLFTRCYHSINLAQSENIFKRMDRMGVFNFAGGIPTSLNNVSGQQWDYPNGWPPLNHMIIEGLRRSENPIMQQKAFWLAEKWVLSNYRVFLDTKSRMWEKYNVVGTKPIAGVGGEYDAQFGFGWTNGVILDLLVTYGDRMHFLGLADNPDGVASSVISTPDATTLPPRLQKNKSDGAINVPPVIESNSDHLQNLKASENVDGEHLEVTRSLGDDTKSMLLASQNNGDNSRWPSRFKDSQSEASKGPESSKSKLGLLAMNMVVTFLVGLAVA
ncbi:trehalase domain-containing protein [Ditylenchus destructor]|nr:trehalase domain-containing protein [Ditylenchus destructor]